MKKVGSELRQELAAWCPLTLFQVKADAADLLKIKRDLEDDKKRFEEAALTKELALQRKIKTIGNYVHESVPISNNEVRGFCQAALAMR